MRDGNGSVMAIEGFIRDNTDRKQAEEELEQSRRNALIGSYIAQDGKFLYVNSEFTRITTYTESELLGTHPLEIVHPDYKEHVRDSAVKMLKGECSVPYEFCIVTRHGEVKWIMETVTPIQYSRKPAALGYFMDVTSMKQAEKERQEKERLQGVLELVGAVGHELNNPMQTITVCSDALSDDMVDSEVLKRNLGLIKQSVARMANTYKKLMNITKYATKEYASGKKIIDINEASQ
jgi:PAS domain S-box-containing protein